jgi:hypothetical protein
VRVKRRKLTDTNPCLPHERQSALSRGTAEQQQFAPYCFSNGVTVQNCSFLKQRMSANATERCSLETAKRVLCVALRVRFRHSSLFACYLLERLLL